MKKLIKKYRAFGILEVLVAIVIFGTTFLLATMVTVKSLKTVKENELTDLANSIMIRTMEFAKSPAISVNSLQNGNAEPWSFYLDGDISDPQVSLNASQIIYDSSISEKIKTCDESSQFKVDFTASGSLFLICNQIFVETIPSSTSLKVTVRVVYLLSDGLHFSEVKGYKNG